MAGANGMRDRRIPCFGRRIPRDRPRGRADTGALARQALGLAVKPCDGAILFSL